MRKEKAQDERILKQKRQIGNDAFQILFYALLVSVLIQQYLFNAPFSQYAVECILLLGISGYIILRNIMVGNDLFGKEYSQKLVVVNSLVAGFMLAVVNTVLNYLRYTFKPDTINTLIIFGITFLSASVIAFACLESIYLINQKRQKQIESILDKQENDD